MILSEIFFVFLFLFVVGSVFYIEFRWCFHTLTHVKSTPPPPFWPSKNHKNEKLFTRILNILFFSGILCILYGYFIEPSQIKTSFIEIKSPKIKASSKRIRLVHISDLHTEKKVLNEIKAAELINFFKPDLVFVTGDFLNDVRGVPIVQKMMRDIHSNYGIFAVRGNMDYLLSMSDLLKDTPVTLLRGKPEKLNIRGTSIIITDAVTRELPPSSFSIFLNHYPDLIDEVSRHNVDLYLAGHTHGGQVRLPLYGAVITFSSLGKKYEAGAYRVGKTMLYVNCGLGLEGGGISPPVRFLCPPEITVIDLLPAK